MAVTIQQGYSFAVTATAVVAANLPGPIAATDYVWTSADTTKVAFVDCGLGYGVGAAQGAGAHGGTRYNSVNGPTASIYGVAAGGPIVVTCNFGGGLFTATVSVTVAAGDTGNVTGLSLSTT